jgi:NADPH:quinone reductase-like Zn-dependent oxidoreductase
LVSPTGTYILFGNANAVTGENRGLFSFAKGWWSQVEKIHPMKLFEENKTIGGLNVRTLIKNSRPKVEQALEKVWDMMAKREVSPFLDSTFHFEQVRENLLYATLRSLTNIFGNIIPTY